MMDLAIGTSSRFLLTCTYTHADILSKPEYQFAYVPVVAVCIRLSLLVFIFSFPFSCSSGLIRRKTSGSALGDTSSRMSTLPIAFSPIFGPPPTNNSADSSTEEPATLVRKLAGGRLGSLTHFEWMEDIESDLAGLSREALISVVLEVVSALADTLPAEVEAARAEINARLTKNYGDELLRMEEQYELVYFYKKKHLSLL